MPLKTMEKKNPVMTVVVVSHRGLAHLKSQIMDHGTGEVIMQHKPDPVA